MTNSWSTGASKVKDMDSLSDEKDLSTDTDLPEALNSGDSSLDWFMNAFVDVSFFPREAKPLTSYRKFWAARFGTAPFLPMSRSEMTQLGGLPENASAAAPQAKP